jgi:hypothetical protein
VLAGRFIPVLCASIARLFPCRTEIARCLTLDFAISRYLFLSFPFLSEQISLKRCFHRCFSFQIPVQNPFFFCFLKTKLLICKDNIVSIRTDIAFLLFSSYNDKHVNSS